jgi:hypothetical protein
MPLNASIDTNTNLFYDSVLLWCSVASFPKRRESSASSLRKPQNLYNNLVTDVLYPYIYIYIYIYIFRSKWPRGLRCRSKAARLLWSWVRIPQGAWMFVCCVCCGLSDRGLCDELITRPEVSYRLWCVVMCDQETSSTRRPLTALGCTAT